MKKRVVACRTQDVGDQSVVPVSLAPSPEGFRREALVLRDGAGALKVYRNQCKHIPVLLDSGTRRFTTKSGDELLCLTHGARYRRSDGLCTWGPCEGEHLDALAFEVVEGQVVVIDD